MGIEDIGRAVSSAAEEEHAMSLSAKQGRQELALQHLFGQAQSQSSGQSPMLARSGSMNEIIKNVLDSGIDERFPFENLPKLNSLIINLMARVPSISPTQANGISRDYADFLALKNSQLGNERAAQLGQEIVARLRILCSDGSNPIMGQTAMSTIISTRTTTDGKVTVHSDEQPKQRRKFFGVF